jgi:hypothetical protein
MVGRRSCRLTIFPAPRFMVSNEEPYDVGKIGYAALKRALNTPPKENTAYKGQSIRDRQSRKGETTTSKERK